MPEKDSPEISPRGWRWAPGALFRNYQSGEVTAVVGFPFILKQRQGFHSGAHTKTTTPYTADAEFKIVTF